MMCIENVVSRDELAMRMTVMEEARRRREARALEEADALAQDMASREVAHELARVEKQLMSVRADWTKPSDSLPNIYPPGKLPRAMTPGVGLSPQFRRGADAGRVLPQPRPLTYFHPEAAFESRARALSLPGRIHRNDKVLSGLRRDPWEGATVLVPLKTIVPVNARNLGSRKSKKLPPPTTRRSPLDPRAPLVAQLLHYLLADLIEDPEMYVEATNRIAQSFSAWDTDGSGSISRYEFAKAMAVIGFPCTSEELHALFMELDADGSGSITYAELLAATRVHTPMFHGNGLPPAPPPAARTRPNGTAQSGGARGTEYITSTQNLPPIEAPMSWVDGRSMAGQIADMLKDQMRRVTDTFQKWDTDGRGTIEFSEFSRAMAALGLKSTRKVEELWRQFDADGSGAINLEELRMALEPSKLGAVDTAGGAGGLMAVPDAYGGNLNSLSSETINKEMHVGLSAKLRSPTEQMHEAFDEMATDRVLDVFKAWDADNTGTLSRAEFAKAMVRMGVKCTRAELFKLFNEIDPDGSGEINYRELYWAIKERRGYVKGSRSRDVAKPEGWAEGR